MLVEIIFCTYIDFSSEIDNENEKNNANKH